MRRALALAAALPMIAGCTPQELRAFARWHQQDPAAAEAFSNQPEIQAQLHSEPANESEPPGTLPAVTPGTLPPVAEVQRGVWDRLAACESGERWNISTGNGYYGGLQFSLRSWRAVGGQGYPHQNSREEQIRRAEMLLDIQGWGAWPSCSRRLGLR